MKSAAIELAGKLGGYQLARLLTRKQPKILMYHRFSAEKKGHEVTAATFEQQLRLIKKYFQPMTLANLALAIQKNGTAPTNAVVITVDDGYRDFYEVAYPLLKRYQVPATFFVTTGFVNQDLWLWPDQVLWLLRNRQCAEGSLQVGDKTFDLTQPVKQLWWPLVLHLLNVANAIRLNAIAELAQRSAVDLPSKAPEEFAAVNWEQLREMQQHGIEIGGHTRSHPSLGHMPVLEAQQEIETSFNDLCQHLGEQPRTFCYPNGQPADYSEDIKKIVSQSGFLAAVTAYSDRFNTDLPWAWRRFVGCEEQFQFYKSLFGVEHLGNRIRNTRRCDY
ncbi:polysaccharide deacetylase family protein [Cellvibrio fontiphilus]|uniref:Polysaccharide deacetylase family protein n=1 Tax=Cellvibrio fontiphilus TaxID=1815559 RepID=A0ABV7FBS4_9GAMM